MRTPIGLIICLLAGAAGANATIAPAAAGLRLRAPLGRGVTLAVYPSPALAGEPALVAGRVSGPGAPDATVTLWQRPPGAARATVLAQVSAEATGAFVFTRADAPLDQTETLYATAAGLRSHPVHESVAAAVTLAAQSAIVTSGTPVALSGRVTPVAHAGEPVLVQQRLPGGWQTVGRATIAGDGSFGASPTFIGTHAVALRALFAGDAHNLAGVSDPVDLLVQAAPGGRLSLLASSNPLTLGQTVTLSGTLAGNGPAGANANGTGTGTGTGAVTAGIPVTLLAGPDTAGEQPVASTLTDGAGNFSFSQTPSATTVYGVRIATLASAPVVVGVQRTVTLAASTLTAPLGATQSIQGTVAGAGAGADVALQLLGGDGVFHSIARAHVSGASAGGAAAFSFVTTLTDPGSETYRVLSGADATNQSGFSLPLTVLVTPRAALQVAAALGQA